TLTGKVTTTSGAAGTGPVTILADSDSDGTGTISEVGGIDTSATNSAIRLQAAQFSLTGTINSGTVTTTLEASDNQTIGLGSGAGNIQFSNTTLALINSGTLVIGGAQTGNITAEAVSTGTKQGTVSLVAGATGANVVFSGGSSFDALEVTARNQIQFNTTDIPAVQTTGAQTYHSPVQLLNHTTLTSTSSGDINFQSTIDGTFDLTINTKGITTFGGAVGGTDTLKSITTDANGTTEINGGAITTTGAQTFNDAVTLGNTPTPTPSTTLTSTGNGNIAFGKTLDSQSATPQNLTILAGSGDVTFTGQVGTTHALGALLVSSSQNILASASVTAQAVSLTATNDVTLTGKVTTTSGAAGTGPVTILADSDSDGTGTVSEAGGIDTSATNSAIRLQAAQFSLTGTIKSGTATTTLEASDNQTIGLGSGAGNIQFSNTTLALINSGTLVIGGAQTGNITAEAVSTGTKQGTVSLVAGATGANVVFNGASTFGAGSPGTPAIKALAAHDVIVTGSIATTNTPNPGDVYLEAQRFLTMQTGSSITTTPGTGGKLTIQGAITVNDVTVGAGNVTLIGNAAGANDLVISGKLTSSGTINLEAPRDIIIIGSLKTTSSTADIVLHADKTNTGIGGVWVTATGDLNSGQDIQITGSDLFTRSLLSGSTPDLPNPSTKISVEIAHNTQVVPANSLVAGRHITISSGPNSPSGAMIEINGAIVAGNKGNVTLTASGDVVIAAPVTTGSGNVSVTSAGNITFSDFSPVVIGGIATS
ncbi:MAG: hypothetical protein JSS02_35250, partial [Planctomycetes bacterium]|nr:hypothetical protein [Planctomycetota bacterium]